MPQHIVSFATYLRAWVTAVVVGLLGGLILRVVAVHLWRIPFLIILLLGGLGYLVGEIVSWIVKRKRSRGLQFLLLVGVLLPIMIGFGPAVLNITILIGIAIAVAISFSRLR